MAFISPSTRIHRTRLVCLGTPLATCALPTGVFYLLTLLTSAVRRARPLDADRSHLAAQLRSSVKHYAVVCFAYFTDSFSQRRGLGLFFPCSLAPGTTPSLFINML